MKKFLSLVVLSGFLAGCSTLKKIGLTKEERDEFVRHPRVQIENKLVEMVEAKGIIPYSQMNIYELEGKLIESFTDGKINTEGADGNVDRYVVLTRDGYIAYGNNYVVDANRQKIEGSGELAIELVKVSQQKLKEATERYNAKKKEYFETVINSFK